MTAIPPNPGPDPIVPPQTEGEKNPPPPPPPPPPPTPPVKAPGGTEIKAKKILKQTTNIQYNLSGAPLPPLSSLVEDLLPKLPPRYHPFQAPDHGAILQLLEQDRIVLLQSYNEEAAYAAGHKLVYDETFSKNKARKVLFPALEREKGRADLELRRVIDNDFLREHQILLVELNDNCTFLNSVLAAGRGVLDVIYNELERRSSYVILSVDEKLVNSSEKRERLRRFSLRTVSYLRYLLFPHYADQAGEMEARIEATLNDALAAERYELVLDHLSRGRGELEKFLDERTAAKNFTPEPSPASQSPTIELSDIFKEDSEAHRAATFVAASLPQLNQRDFDRLVCLLLGNKTTSKETVRHAFRRDGKLVTVREKTVEHCTKQWFRDADKIFQECHLRTITLEDESRIIDFCEPHLRTKLRSYLDETHPWYLKRQCERLQRLGVLFSDDLSSKSIDGLVALFVERAVVDPFGFGSSWLVKLVLNERLALQKSTIAESAGEADDADETPFWLDRQLPQKDRRDRFLERLVILLREMLRQDILRPTVRQFFDNLMISNQQDALLVFIIHLAPRLRSIPGLDPLIWIRRLLDEGGTEILDETIRVLIDLARRNGAKIYEFLHAIHDWLPDIDRPPAAYSPSNAIAIRFPFAYCEAVAQWVTPGIWPSQHPLFYALPDGSEEARKTLESLIEWIVDARSAALEEADASDPLQSAEAVSIGFVANLVEHWSWVLEGPPSQTPPPEGTALFSIILDQLNSKLKPSRRLWLQRGWQQRQEELLGDAATKSGQERKNVIARKTRLEQLRIRYAAMAGTRRISIQGEPAS